ncbi:MAG: YbhB/YbcL family Raf kinase inhibitor-like protein [Deltaproteobacteria bacterium]|nr:YbhB/YbcL family Raf kinase inhibitor-like protein [Deltaproteobacteria bacterium]
MKLTSPAFGHKERIPEKYTCHGENISPPLKIADVPPGAKALVLIMEDPDVPRTLREDGMWDHWILFNMPPELTDIAEGEEPPGHHGAGTAGNTDYYGPCPPDAEHRYFFKLFALDSKLNLPERASKRDVMEAMSGHVMDSAELIGLYAPK